MRKRHNPLASSSPTLTPDEALLRQGWKYIEQKNYIEALKCFKEIPSDAFLKDDFHQRSLLLGKSRCYQERRYFKKALLILDTMLKQDSKNKKTLFSKARCLESMGDFENAIDTFDEILEKIPNDKLVLIGKARCYQAMGDFENAIYLYQAMYQEDLEDKTVFLGLARCAAEMNNFEYAMQTYARMQEAFPNDLQVFIGVARCLEEMGQFKKAIATFNETLAIYKKNKLVLYGKAKCYELMGEMLSAQKVYDVMLALDPKDEDALLGKVKCLERNGLLKDAMSILEKLRQHDPNSIKVLLRIVKLFEKMGDFEIANIRYKSLSQKFPGQIDLQLEHGLFCERHYGFEVVVSHYESVAQNFPFSAKPDIYLSKFYLANENYQKAIVILQSTVKKHPYYQPAKEDLIHCLTENGDFPSAIQQAQEDIAAFPYNKALYEKGIRTLLLDNQHDEAQKLYQAFLANFPYAHSLRKKIQIYFHENNATYVSLPKGQLVLPDAVASVFRVIQENGYHAYVVGGWVRDTLLYSQTPPRDIDIVTDLPKEKRYLLPSSSRQSHFRENLYTYKIDGLHMDIVCKDTPLSTEANLLQDAKTRDFTMNALYVPLAGNVICPLKCAINDLYDGRLKTIADAKVNFQENPIIMLRMLRFTCQNAALFIPTKIYEILKESAPFLSDACGARLKNEIKKCFLSGFGRKAFPLLERQGVMKVLFPEMTTAPSYRAFQPFMCCELKKMDEHFPNVSFNYLLALFLCAASSQNPKEVESADAFWQKLFDKDLITRDDQNHIFKLTPIVREKFKIWENSNPYRNPPLTPQYQRRKNGWTTTARFEPNGSLSNQMKRITINGRFRG